MSKQILIIEDEPKLAQLLKDYLTQSGYQTRIIDDGQDAIHQLTPAAQMPDLILLDLMLPNVDGMEICKHVRQFSNVPIIMTTAKVEEIDRLLGLEMGADDYVCKPYSPREVVARTKAQLRRADMMNQGAQVQQQSLTSNGFTIDESKYQASIDGVAIELTAVEFQILNTLAKEPGRIFNRQQLMDRCYQDHRVVSDRTIDSHIRKLRKRVKEASPEKELIQSVYGVGYKFELSEADQ